MSASKKTTKKASLVAVDFKIIVDVKSLPVYEGPNSATEIVNLLRREEVYDISAMDKGFGKLSNGAGWIDLKHVRRV